MSNNENKKAKDKDKDKDKVFAIRPNKTQLKRETDTLLKLGEDSSRWLKI